MSTIELRTTITNLLLNVNDERFLKSLLVMVKEYSHSQPKLSDSQLAELNERVATHRNGQSETYPWKDSLNAIRKELGK